MNDSHEYRRLNTGSGGRRPANPGSGRPSGQRRLNTSQAGHTGGSRTSAPASGKQIRRVSTEKSGFDSAAGGSSGGRPPRGPGKKHGKGRSVWSVVWRFLAACVCLCVMLGSVAAVLMSMYVVKATAADAQLLDLDELKLAETTIIYDRYGEEYARLSGENNRMWAYLDEIPEDLQNAFICTEDKTFRTHHGVNIKRTISATANYALNRLTHGAVSLYDTEQGASTITQQLIKNITKDDDADAMRKVREVFRAFGLENRYSKDTILEAYLNTIALTGTNAGVRAGADVYFGKELSELELQECASIAAITKNPTKYNPYTNPEQHLVRRNDVLYFMYQQGAIDQAEYEAASAAPLRLAENQSEQVVTHSSNNSYYTDAVVEALVQDIIEEEGFEGENARSQAFSILYNGGLRVYTTVDPKVQRTMEEIMLNQDDKYFPAQWRYEEFDMGNRTVEDLEAMEDSDLLQRNEDGSIKLGTSKEGKQVYFKKVRTQAAMVTMNYDGEVVAMVGGLGEKTVDRALNRALEPRPTGSTMKPLAAYALAVESGAVHYSSLVPDEYFYRAEDKKVLLPQFAQYGVNNPAMIARGDVWRNWPQNFEGEPSHQDVLLGSALAHSKNTCAVWVGSMVGPDLMYNFAKNTLGMAHLTDENNADVDYGPIVLGSQSYGVTPLELAAAFQIFGNGGVYNPPHYYTEVYNNKGDLYIDKTPDLTSTEAISPSTALIMNRLLYGVTHGGTANGMNPAGGMEAVGKTGTTSEFKDFTWAGLTPYYVTAAWWGYDKPYDMTWQNRRQSGKPMQLAWKELMEKVQDGLETKHFPNEVEGVVTARYCTESGDIAGPNCPNTAVGYYRRDNMPGTCTRH